MSKLFPENEVAIVIDDPDEHEVVNSEAIRQSFIDYYNEIVWNRRLAIVGIKVFCFGLYRPDKSSTG